MESSRQTIHENTPSSFTNPSLSISGHTSTSQLAFQRNLDIMEADCEEHFSRLMSESDDSLLASSGFLSHRHKRHHETSYSPTNANGLGESQLSFSAIHTPARLRTNGSSLIQDLLTPNNNGTISPLFQDVSSPVDLTMMEAYCDEDECLAAHGMNLTLPSAVIHDTPDQTYPVLRNLTFALVSPKAISSVVDLSSATIQPTTSSTLKKSHASLFNTSQLNLSTPCSSPRVLPDQQAFFPAAGLYQLGSNNSCKSSPRHCPPTPARTPSWQLQRTPSTVSHSVRDHAKNERKSIKQSSQLSCHKSSGTSKVESLLTKSSSSTASDLLNNAPDESQSSLFLPSLLSRFDDGVIDTFQNDAVDKDISRLMIPPTMPPVMRQNSLCDNKILIGPSIESKPMHIPASSSQNRISLIQDFIIDGIIGGGNFAEVYRVIPKVQHESHRYQGSYSVFYAVKKMKERLRSRKNRDWLLNEVRIMHSIGRHEHIVPFIQAWQEDGYLYVQLELAARGSLRDFMQRWIDEGRILPNHSLWKIIHDAVCGLEFIHSKGYVHLDIKPGNLLINENGDLMIGDFGMATKAGTSEDDREGDPSYMAVEILRTSERYPSADIFSLGLTVYEASYTAEQLRHGDLALPSEGPLWLKLREDGADWSTRDRPSALIELINACMYAVPSSRPSSSEIMTHPHVVAVRVTDMENIFGQGEAPLMSKEVRRTSGSQDTLLIPPSLILNVGGNGMDDVTNNFPAFTPR